MLRIGVFSSRFSTFQRHARMVGASNGTRPSVYLRFTSRQFNGELKWGKQLQELGAGDTRRAASTRPAAPSSPRPSTPCFAGTRGPVSAASISWTCRKHRENSPRMGSPDAAGFEGVGHWLRRSRSISTTAYGTEWAPKTRSVAGCQT